MEIIYNKSPDSTKCVLVNYANWIFKNVQKKNSKSGINVGRFSKVVSYSPSDIDKQFYLKNKSILTQKKGNGYWIWKPYFIKKELENLNEGEFLFYCDSGAYFINSIDYLIRALNLSNQDIMSFELLLKESTWTKRDAFVFMDCDSPEFTETNQRYGSFILIKKSPLALTLIDDWLKFAQNENIITDIDNICGLPNYKGFNENRHDQSIFSLLTKKYNIRAFRTPTAFCEGDIEKYTNSNYPQIIEHTRLPKSWIMRILRLIHKLKPI